MILLFFGALVTRGVDNWFSNRVRTVAEFSTTVRTRLENQLSTPRVTRAPKNSRITIAGTRAARANMRTNRRCRRAPASRDCSRSSRNTRQPITAVRAPIRARLPSTTTRMVRLVGPTAPATGAREDR